MRFAVIGADHLHLFQMVDRLVAAGATAVAHAPDGGLVGRYAGWRKESQERSADDILADESVALVVLAGVPSERAAVALAALRAGKQVLSDKPGVTTPAQLEALRSVLDGRAGRPWTVLFSERFENRAIGEAVAMARAGAIGTVVHVIGAGPHLLSAKHRPSWFWDDSATGGILVDIGSHQVDQFLAITDMTAADVSVVAAAVGNVASPEHPAMQDIGSMTLCGLSGSGLERPGRSFGVGSAKTGGVVGDHRLDYLTAKGLGTWGDCRLTIVGVEGTIEARANVDIAGAEGAEHLIVVDGDGTRRVDISGVVVDWGEQLIADLADDGERLMTQQHAIDVTDVCLRAQAAAGPWGLAGSRL